MAEAHKAALITGGAGRIGRAMALSLAAAGWSVALHYNRSREGAEAVVDEILASGGTAAAVSCDLSDPERTVRLIDQAEATVGPLACLVNNASIYERDDLASFTNGCLTEHMTTNLAAPVLLAHRFAERLPENGSGLVVNMLDHKVFRPTPDYFSYTLSKIGLRGATEMLARALAPEVRVNGIAPGLTLQSGDQTEERFRAIHNQTPLGRGPTEADMCRALQFFVESPAVTGEVLVIDGGQNLRTAGDRLSDL